jgi:hypothetical protein
VAFRSSGQLSCQSGFWRLALGRVSARYLRTAAHGHLDALHLSIWFKDLALVIDPGTGCYYYNSH